LARPLDQFGELGRVVCSSTPWGSDGLFAELYRKASSGELEHALAQTATSAEANPPLSHEWLEQQRVILGEEEFAAEYLADFTAGGSAYFEETAIDEAVSDRGEIPPKTPGYRHFVAGLDPAFGGARGGTACRGRAPARGRRRVPALPRVRGDRSA
jgi:hypothetical protein